MEEYLDLDSNIDSEDWDIKLLESDDESEIDAPPAKIPRKMNRPLEQIDEEIENLKNSNNSGNKYKCQHCKLGFLFLSSLRKHSLSHESVISSTINEIEDTESEEEEQTEGSKFLCKCCKREFWSLEQLEIHEQLHDNTDGTFQCLKCSETFENPTLLIQHMLDHGKVEEIFNCSQCVGRNFESQKILDIHLRIHFAGVSPYSCEMCSKGFNFLYAFELHMKRHTGEKLYQCKYCLVSYNSLQSFRNHKIFHKDSVIKTGVEEVQLFRCRHCDLEMTSVQDLHSHNAKQHNDTSNKCLLCEKTFSTFSSLSVHLRRHTNIRKFNCSDCDQKFVTSSGLARHIFTHAQQKPFQCGHCVKNFASRSDLNKHEQIHTGKRYGCHICDKAYTTSTSLATHLKTHEPKSDTPIVCPKCNLTCKSKIQLALHIKTVHDRGLIECDICRKLFSSLQAFTVHSTNHHLNSEETNILQAKCLVCDKTYSNQKSLKEHNKRKHQNLGDYPCSSCKVICSTKFALDKHQLSHEKPFALECKKCKLYFVNSSELESHQLNHEDDPLEPDPKPRQYKDKPVTCDICLKVCRGKWWLDVHKRIHTGEKPFKCDHCDHRSYTKANLKSHQKKHSGLREHKCPVCFKSFSVKKTLILHSYTHEIIRPFSCDICGRTFVTKYTLNQHTLRHVRNKESMENFPDFKREIINRHEQIKVNRAKKHTDNMELRLEETEAEDGIYILQLPAGFDAETDEMQLLFDDHSQEVEELVESSEVHENAIIENEEIYPDHNKMTEIDDENSKDFMKSVLAYEVEEMEEIEMEEIGHLIEEDIEYQDESELNEEQSIEEDPAETIQIEHISQPMPYQSRLYKTKSITTVSLNACMYCKIEFSTHEELQTHLKEEAIKRPFKCDECQFAFMQKGKLKRHQKIHNNQKDFKCDICGMAFIQNYTLKQHMLTHSDIPKPLSCKVCRKGFRKQTALNTHLYTCAAKNSEEGTINEYESLDAIRSLNTNRKTGEPILVSNSSESEFQCNFCPKTFDKISLLRSHVKLHGDPEVLIQCDTCLKLIKPEKMHQHIKEYHPTVRHRCPQCLKIYSTFDRLKNHVERVHTTELLYKCGYADCHKAFSTSHTLKNHIKTHSMQMIQCEICEQLLKGKSNFQKHFAKHMIGKTLDCNKCDMWFFDKQSLHAHLVKHHITITVE